MIFGTKKPPWLFSRAVPDVLGSSDCSWISSGRAARGRDPSAPCALTGEGHPLQADKQDRRRAVAMVLLEVFGGDSSQVLPAVMHLGACRARGELAPLLGTGSRPTQPHDLRDAR